MNFIMNRFFRAPVRTFLAGLLAVLPVALTVGVIVWIAGLVAEFVGPDSLLAKPLVSIGLTVVETRIGAYVIGLAWFLGPSICWDCSWRRVFRCGSRLSWIAASGEFR